ncbi:glycosyltransferase [Beduini massiliensis]|uniref:glycosyltransferase n=1 Tax=Beduini massiliensis TaxID=1585974 RepID=UPI00059A8BE4|nr:glycosyltransferase [Beduini massiliensis]
MKKILIYYKSLNRLGGIERVISNWANELATDYKITILTKDSVEIKLYFNDKITIKTLSVMREDSKNNSLINIIKSRHALKKFLKHNDFDFIYTATIIETFEIYLTSKKYLKRVIASEHGSFFAYNKCYIMLRKLIYPHIYKVICPNKMDTEIYKQLNFNVTYIPHLITFSPISKIEKKEKIILNVGRLTNDKQQLLLLKMWNDLNLKNNLNDWKLYIIGSGELKSEIEDYVRIHKLENTVSIIEATKNIKDYYLKASIFAFSSKMEGFGMVLIEAMAYGNCCISFDCPSSPKDIIKNNYNGFLIPCFNESEYEKKLLSLIKNDQLRNRLNENALNSMNKWDNGKIKRQMRDIFN